MHISHCNILLEQQGYAKVQFAFQINRNMPHPPPPLSHTNFGRKTLVLHFICFPTLLSHRKYVSPRLLFFFNPRRNRSFFLPSIGLDNWLRLPAGLGDLLLYPEEDGWYSVLGPWKGTTDNPDDANEDNPEANLDIPISPVNPPRNARPDPTPIFCEYPKCSGNRLAIPFPSTLLSPSAILTGTLPPPQWPSFLRSRSIHLPDTQLLPARPFQDQASPQQTLPI